MREKVTLRTDGEVAQHLLAHRQVDARDCWIWTRAVRGEAGYGVLWYRPYQRVIGVHRLAAYLWLGFDLASPLYVCHRCDNPPCFNPDHLFIGTNSDNILDARDKGRLNRRRGEQRSDAKMTEENVRHLRQLRRERGISYPKLGRLFSISDETARNICLRRAWKHVP